MENLAKAIIEGPETEHTMPYPGWVVLKTSTTLADLDDGLSDGLFLVGKQARLYRGAALGISGQNDVVRLRILAERVLLGVIELDSTHGKFARPIDLIRFLESEDRLENAKNWLEQREDEHSKALAKYVEGTHRGERVAQ